MLIINDFADSQWEESKKKIYEKVSECRRHTCERNIMCVCEWEGAHDTLQSQVVVLIRRGSVWKRFWVKAWRFQTEREAFVLMDRSSLWALISTFASIYTICFFFYSFVCRLHVPEACVARVFVCFFLFKSFIFGGKFCVLIYIYMYLLLLPGFEHGVFFSYYMHACKASRVYI